MYICNALLKHGYPNFSLTILEYCSPEKCLEREKHYLDLFKSEDKYNIAQDPTAPMSGRKHSDESRKKMSGENNPMFGKNHTDESHKKMSDVHKKIEHPGNFKTGENNPNFGKNLSEETRKKISDAQKGRPRTEGAGSPSQAIEVIDNKNNQTTTYDSISAAAIALNLKQSRISMYFANNQQKPYKGIYTFKKVN
jgi:group I intron endonuclease